MAGATDHLLLDTVQRRMRQPAGWIAVVLHLSRLGAPGPRPHHRRIARVLMEDVARRHDGLVYATINGDLLLLCRMAAEPRRKTTVRVASPQALPDVLARLLRAELPEPRDLISLWPLETAGEMLLTYAQDRVATESGVPIAANEARSHTGAIEALHAAATAADFADLLRRQTAVVINEDGMRPLFREIRFSLPALERRAGYSGRADADPFLFGHLAERLDRQLLGRLANALGSGGGLDAAMPDVPRLHVNLTLASLRSDDFARLADLMLEHGLPFGVEITVVEACADPDRFEEARDTLQRLRIVVVLDGVSAPALRLASPASLRPDLLKLTWSPALSENGQAGQKLIEAVGPDRIVLHHAETEAAVHWGMERGVRRFQGHQVTAMLAALRMFGCRFAAGCTLHQCAERAAATDRAGRRDCLNLPLLDAGAPAPAARRSVARVAA